MGNPFAKIAEQRAQAAKQPEPEEKKLVNPFQKKAAGGSSPQAKVSNPFAKSAASATSGPTSPAPGTAAVPEVASSPPVQNATSGPTASAEKQVSAEEFTHESQPVEYTQEQMDNLQLALVNLQNSFGGKKEQIGDAIRMVGVQLAEHPALCGIMRPEDWGLFVSGLREGYGVAIAKRGERRGKAKERTEAEQKASDIIDNIEGFDF